MNIDESHLQGKGWSSSEIERVLSILDTAESSKDTWVQRVEDNLHWLFLFIAVAANVTLAFVSLPLVVATPPSYLLPVMAVIGVTYGSICTAVFHQLDELDAKHHFLYVLFTLVVGVAGFGVVVAQANRIVAWSGVGYEHSGLVAVTYLVSFLIPYAGWRKIR